MKNIIFSLLSLCLLTMWGCEKDAFVDERKQAQSERSDEEARGNHDIHLGFIQNYYNGQVTTRSTYYGINDAVSMMNEGLNKLYCRPGVKLYDSTFTFFDTVTVPVNGSFEIHENDIAGAMDDFAGFAGDIFYDRTTEDTSRVSWAFVVERADEPSGGYVDLGVMYVLQEGEFVSHGDTYPYQNVHPWFYDDNTGETVEDENCCNETAGAEDMFRNDLRDALVYQKQPTERKFIYLNLQVITFVASSAKEMPLVLPDMLYESYTAAELINTEDETEEDNLLDYLLWINDSQYPNFHECLSVDEMDFHYEEMYDLVDLQQPTGTDVIAEIEVGFFSFDIGNTVRQHAMQGWYADKVNLAIFEEEVTALPGGGG